jgi:hypothetical protein
MGVHVLIWSPSSVNVERELFASALSSREIVVGTHTHTHTHTHTRCHTNARTRAAATPRRASAHPCRTLREAPNGVRSRAHHDHPWPRQLAVAGMLVYAQIKRRVCANLGCRVPEDRVAIIS